MTRLFIQLQPVCAHYLPGPIKAGTRGPPHAPKLSDAVEESEAS